MQWILMSIFALAERSAAMFARGGFRSVKQEWGFISKSRQSSLEADRCLNAICVRTLLQ